MRAVRPSTASASMETPLLMSSVAWRGGVGGCRSRHRPARSSRCWHCTAWTASQPSARLPMVLSSGFGGSDLVGLAVAEHGVQDVDAASCERDDGLVVGLAFGSFAGVEGAAGGVAERAERGLDEDAFEGAVAGWWRV